MSLDNSTKKVLQLINICWDSYKHRVASGLVNPENEKTMQLQIAQTIQTLIPVFEYSGFESIKILLEEPVRIKESLQRRIIDIVIRHETDGKVFYFPIELKCFRQYTREGRQGKDKKRGAEPISMSQYWQDIENIECYSRIENFGIGTQLTLTDHAHFISAPHEGRQSSPFSTRKERCNITGSLVSNYGSVKLNGTYNMNGWEKIGDFFFIMQRNNNTN